MICNDCKEDLPESAFSANRGREFALNKTCNKCKTIKSTITKRIKSGKQEELDSGHKFCKYCNQTKDLGEFYNNTKSKYGAFCNSLSSKCKDCTKLCRKGKYKEYNKAYKANVENRVKINARKKVEYWEKIEARLFNQAKGRARRVDLEFNLTKEDIKVPEYCPILKVAFDKNRYAPSLDRFDNSKGYIKGNVWVISKVANTMKNDATLQELQTFSKSFLQILTQDIVQPNGKPLEP